MTILSLLLLSVVLDIGIGEPPSALHPVVWMGLLIARCENAIETLSKLLPRYDKKILFIGGCLMAYILPSGIFMLVWWLLKCFEQTTFGWVGEALEMMLAIFFLKSTFSIRALFVAASRVKKALLHHDIDQSFYALKSLCSRRALSKQDVISGTICSLAENTSDSVVAPIMMALLFGLPGAFFYRCVNTMDAMIGYHHKHYHWLGWGAARLDDALNIIPARLTSFLFLLGGFFLAFPVGQGWKTIISSAHNTPSPNGGWPMSAVSGLLNVSLWKKSVYTLGKTFPLPTVDSIGHAQNLMIMTLLVPYTMLVAIFVAMEIVK